MLSDPPPLSGYSPAHPAVMVAITSPYAVFPAGHAPTMRRYTKTGANAERILFREVPAWLVDLPALREVQRQWSVRQHGRPRVDECHELIALASGALTAPFPKGKGFRWKARFWREELCRMKAAAVTWLSINEHSESRRVFLDPQGMWLSHNPLTDDELRFTGNEDRTEPVPVLIAGKCSAAMVILTDEWEGVELVHSVPNRGNPAGRKIEPDELVRRLWAYLPEADPDSPPDVSRVVQYGCMAWPDSAAIDRGAGVSGRPKWLRDQKSDTDDRF